MNLMKVRFKWRTQTLDFDPTDPCGNDETDTPATEAPVGNAPVLNTILLYEGNGCWYVNEGQNWWTWCAANTVLRVRLRKNGSVQAVARRISASGSGTWDDLDTVDPPGNVALRDACTIRDGTPVGAPPAPCRWVIQGGKAYRIC